jgi:putative sterol carrier protein
VDLKQDGSITKGVSVNKKPDVIIHICDGDFVDFSKGRLNGIYLIWKILHYWRFTRISIGQRAFMSGRLKIKGQIRLATKLDTIFKQLAGKSKL